MRSFKLKENEEFIKAFNNIVVYANDNKYMLTIFLTNERLVLLQDINKEFDYNKFLSSRGICIPVDLEVINEISLREIKEIECLEEVNYITLKNSDNYLKIYAEDLNKYIK